MLQRIFTWWNGATIGAFFDIGRRGRLVGEDEQGNRYYEERRASLEGRKRRYVIYSGLAEASKVPGGATEAEVLTARGLTGIRLSCQILCDHDMSVRATSRLAGSAKKDVGPEPAAEIEPPPEWVD